MVNEALCKVLCHNLCVIIQAMHELGIEAKFDVKPSQSATQFSIGNEKIRKC